MSQTLTVTMTVPSSTASSRGGTGVTGGEEPPEPLPPGCQRGRLRPAGCEFREPVMRTDGLSPLPREAPPYQGTALVWSAG